MIHQSVVLEPVPSSVSLRVSARRAVDRLLVATARPEKHRALTFPVVGLGLVLVTGATYLAGGRFSSVAHLYYLPILAGAYFYGVPGGVVTATLAGSLCAVIPTGARFHDVAAYSWGLDLLGFLAVGVVTGLVVTAFVRERVGHLRLIDEAARGLWRALDTQDHATAEHAERVSVYAQQIAREMGLPPGQVELVREAGLVHNIGRLATPHGSTVTPYASESILHEMADLEPLIPIVRGHTENWNGSGFPDGLHSHEIPLEARIIAVANAYDRFTTSAPDWVPVAPDAAVGLIRAEAGRRLDPDVVDALVNLYARWRVVLAPDFFTHSQTR